MKYKSPLLLYYSADVFKDLSFQLKLDNSTMNENKRNVNIKN